MVTQGNTGMYDEMEDDITKVVVQSVKKGDILPC